VVELFLTVTVVGEYQSFEGLTEAALEMIVEQERVTLTGAERTAIHDRMQRLPAYADVRPSLERLESAGLRLAALTNSAENAARALTKQAGLGKGVSPTFRGPTYAPSPSR
jgi:2-haloacid dehalogenase